MSASSKIDPTATPALPDVNNTALLPGSTWGQRCVVSPDWVSRGVNGWGVPPVEETLDKTAPMSGVNTIVPSSPQLPPRSVGASQRVTATPPAQRFFSVCRQRKNRSTGYRAKRRDRGHSPSRKAPWPATRQASGRRCAVFHLRRWQQEPDACRRVRG